MILKALDVSKHQGDFDPQRAKQQGIDTVFLRAGYGTDRDKMFARFAEKCRAQDLRMGAYLFMTSHYRQYNGGDVRLAERLQNQQLDSLFETLKGAGVTSWVALDQELEGGRTMGLTPRQNTDLLNRAAARVKAAGYAPCLYCSASWLKNHVQAERLVMPVWAAYYYRSKASCDPDFASASPLQAVNTGWGRYLLGLGDQICAWQFASRGQGSRYGVKSDSVDRSWLYYQPEELAQREACRMGFEQQEGLELVVT
ncbi:Glycoside hydrolase, family 25, partial [gut metagenome]